jgi:hypothetical protein
VLARLEEQRPWWQPGPDEELLLRPGTRPVRMLSDTERARLAMHGINPLVSLRAANQSPLPLRTLAQGAAASNDGGRLAARRRWLQLMNSLERGTRWALYDVRDRNTWSRMRGQAEAFLKPLADAGLFGEGPAEAAFHVVCDERLNTGHDLAAGQVHMLVSLRGSRPNEYRSFLITHGAQGSRVRPVRSNVLPAGLRLSIMASTTDEVVDVVADQEPDDLATTQPRTKPADPSPATGDPVSATETTARGADDRPHEPEATLAVEGGDDEPTTLVAKRLEHGPDSTTIVAAPPPHPDESTTDESTTLVLPLSEPAAPGGLDRDDIARFYRDFGGRGERP